MDLILLGNVIYVLAMYAFDVKNLVELLLVYLLMLVVVFVIALVIIFLEDIGGVADI